MRDKAKHEPVLINQKIEILKNKYSERIRLTPGAHRYRLSADGAAGGASASARYCRGWTVKPRLPSTVTAPDLPPSKSLEASRWPVANS